MEIEIIRNIGKFYKKIETIFNYFLLKFLGGKGRKNELDLITNSRCEL